jgi:hypothetical protein
MTLPTFIGVGGQRCGTTWLDGQLRRHPEIFLPERRKEVHYFDRYYARGTGWYEGFFPGRDEALKYKAIGEITPYYLYHSEAALRISETIPGCRILVSLRNPAERAYSQYALAVEGRAEKRSFADYIKEEPEPFERGLYALQLKRYLKYFPADQILVLIFEETNRDPHKALGRISRFLGCTDTFFDTVDLSKKMNESKRTRHAFLYAKARRVGSLLRSIDCDRVVNYAKRIGLPGLFGKVDTPAGEKDFATLERLMARYREDIEELEQILGKDLSFWKEGVFKGGRQ